MNTRPGAVNIGPAAHFAELPAKVVHAGQTYFLTRDGDEYALLSSDCPHQGGQVADTGERFECPVHHWKFDRTNGQCLNAPNRALRRIPVAAIDGFLFADLGTAKHSLAPAAAAQTKPVEQDLSIQLIAHACLSIRHQGRTLLTDPWLFGPAFLGSWTQYPPPFIADDLISSADAIFISHEHSDHFHEPTLLSFPRDTPIYAPDFPNRRIIQRLKEMGFRQVHAMSFGKTYHVAPELRITCFEPASLWNDAIALIETGGFRLLNINDAGVNFRLASVIGPVDALAAQFSPGASGYPWTWSHLEEGEKLDILKRTCRGKLEFLKKAADTYGARSVLPFASYFVPWHPSHRDYLVKAPRNTLDDVLHAFEEHPAELIDILPGETWNVSENHLQRRIVNREDLYRTETLTSYVEQTFAPEAFRDFHPSGPGPSRKELEDYLLGLNDVPEMALSENVSVRIASLGPTPLSVDFIVDGGRLRLRPDADETPQMLIEAPGAILRLLIEQDLSWDEAFIGYWCRFNRSPDVYHPGFWRLLQSPYYKKRPDLSRGLWTEGEISLQTPVEALLERFGEEAERVLGRSGLYCHGCYWAASETLANAAAKHGLAHDRVDALLVELNRLFVSEIQERSPKIVEVQAQNGNGRKALPWTKGAQPEVNVSGASLIR